MMKRHIKTRNFVPDILSNIDLELIRDIEGSLVAPILHKARRLILIYLILPFFAVFLFCNLTLFYVIILKSIIIFIYNMIERYWNVQN